MAKEGDAKPCSVEGCTGTMKFSPNARPPGWHSGIGGEGGKIVWGAQEQPGWECDRHPEHFESALPGAASD